MIRPATVLIALLLPAQAALALEPAECARVRARDDYGQVPIEQMSPEPGEDDDFFIHLTVGLPVDLGQGIVATPENWQSRYQETSAWSFENCRSNRQVLIYDMRRQGDHRTTPPLDPVQAMSAAIASPDELTFEDVAALFGDWASEVHQVEREPCGCAVYYPELRGDRRAWAP